MSSQLRYICSQIITVYIDIATNNKILYRSDHKYSLLIEHDHIHHKTWCQYVTIMLRLYDIWKPIQKFWIFISQDEWIQQFRSTINLIWGILQFNLSRNTICEQNERRMTLWLLHSEI